MSGTLVCYSLGEAAENAAGSPGLVLHSVGCGEDVTIRELAEIVLEVVGFEANLVFNQRAKTDGTPRKLLDITRLKKLGWKPRISLGDGMRQTYG